MNVQQLYTLWPLFSRFRGNGRIFPTDLNWLLHGHEFSGAGKADFLRSALGDQGYKDEMTRRFMVSALGRKGYQKEMQRKREESARKKEERLYQQVLGEVRQHADDDLNHPRADEAHYSSARQSDYTNHERLYAQVHGEYNTDRDIQANVHRVNIQRNAFATPLDVYLYYGEYGTPDGIDLNTARIIDAVRRGRIDWYSLPPEEQELYTEWVKYFSDLGVWSQ